MPITNSLVNVVKYTWEISDYSNSFFNIHEILYTLVILINTFKFINFE